MNRAPIANVKPIAKLVNCAYVRTKGSHFEVKRNLQNAYDVITGYEIKSATFILGSEKDLLNEVLMIFRLISQTCVEWPVYNVSDMKPSTNVMTFTIVGNVTCHCSIFKF